jgi:hypothetical protein
MIRFILRLVSPAYRRLEARNAELDEIQKQADFWRGEMQRLYPIALLAAANGDWDTYQRVRAAFNVAARRYQAEVTDRLA